MVLMTTQKCFTTCNGQTVQVKEYGYFTPKYFHQIGLTEASLPAKTERYIQSCGGGLATEYAYLTGRCACGAIHFVERKIERPQFASNHKCDARCQNARGRKCECSCSGKNHGAN